jgi:hypothetical protein
MRLPHFTLPHFNFRNPFRRAARPAEGNGQGAGRLGPETAQAETAAAAQTRTLGGTRPTGPESLRAPDHVLPPTTQDAPARETGAQQPAAGRSGGASPPPLYSADHSPAAHYTDPPRERHPDDFLTESPPPFYNRSPVIGEHTLDQNHNRMEISPESAALFDLPEHLMRTDDIPPLHLSPRGSASSLDSAELEALLDGLGPLSRFPTPPPRPPM